MLFFAYVILFLGFKISLYFMHITFVQVELQSTKGGSVRVALSIARNDEVALRATGLFPSLARATPSAASKSVPDS